MNRVQPIALFAAIATMVALVPASAAALSDGDPPAGPQATSNSDVRPIDGQQAGAWLDQPMADNETPGESVTGQADVGPNNSDDLVPNPDLELLPDFPSNEFEPDSVPDEGIGQTSGEVINYWVRPEGRYRDAHLASGAVAISAARLPSESKRSTEWDGLLHLTPGDKWASELQWQLGATAEQVCLTQSQSAPLHGEIVITTDRAVTAQEVRLEVSEETRDLADLECTSGSFHQVDVVGVGSGERGSPSSADSDNEATAWSPASRHASRATQSDVRYHRFAVVLPNARAVSALRIWIAPAASRAVVTRVHQIESEPSVAAETEGLWTVAARADGEVAAAKTWQQASAPITMIAGSELPATTKTSDVLFAFAATAPDVSTETPNDAAESQLAADGKSVAHEAGNEPTAEDSADGERVTAQDADQAEDDETEAESDEPDPAGKDTPTPAPEQSRPIEMPDAGVASAAGFGLLALATLGLGGSFGLLARYRRVKE